MQRQLRTLEIMCARTRNENEKFIREAPQHKKEEIRQVLKLSEEADKLMWEIDDLSSSAAQCYLQILNILPQHAQSLCNYAYLIQNAQKGLDKTEEVLDEAEELYKKALQAEPHRVATLLTPLSYLRYSTMLYTLLCVDRYERGVTCMHARSSWNPQTAFSKKKGIFSMMLASATQCSTPDMCRQRLTLSPVEIYKRLDLKRVTSTGCRPMLNPFVCYILNTDSVDMATSANSNMFTRS